MLELPHAAVGAAIASAFPNPVISLPLSFLSHFATDFIPHWNPHLYSEIKKYGRISTRTLSFLAGDSLAALGLGVYLATKSPTPQAINILLSCFFAVLPDVIEIPFYLFNIRSQWLSSLVNFQRRNQWNVPALPGIISQITALLFCLLVIFS